MALPKIDVPTFDLELPGTDTKYKFRPFLVKEDKLLTLALSSGEIPDMLNACRQIIENCSFNKVDTKELPMYLIQWIFLQLRAKSVGETFSFSLRCGGCEETMNYECKTSDFEVVNLDSDISNKIELSESAGIVLKHPTCMVEAELEEMEDIEVIRCCTNYIYNGDEIIQSEDIPSEEFVEFIESMQIHVKDKIVEYLGNKPYLEHMVNFKCKGCDTDNQVSINGYEHFFV